jgi:hypothetical protein
MNITKEISDSVYGSVSDSVWDSVSDSVYDSASASVRETYMTTTIKIVKGTGGAETDYFRDKLITMYERWAAKNGCTSLIHEDIITIVGEGSDALTQEHGVHRFCFISPYDPQGRRHTVFAQVLVNSFEDNLSWTNDRVRNYMMHPVQVARNTKTDKKVNGVDFSVDHVFDGNPDLLWN